MQMALGNSVIQLGDRKILAFRGARDAYLECIDGFVWLTVEGHACDVVLAKGERVRIEKNGLGLIQGLPSGSFQLVRMATGLNHQESRTPDFTFSDLPLSVQNDGLVIRLAEMANGMVNVFKHGFQSIIPMIRY